MDQGSLFDGWEGRRLKEAGQALVTLHQAHDWKGGVASIIATLAQRGEAFTSDDVRSIALESGVGEPEHPNAWGAQISAASKRGDITPCGYTTSNQASRHGAVVRLWTRGS